MSDQDRTVRGMFVSHDDRTDPRHWTLTIRPDYQEDPSQFPAPHPIDMEWDGPRPREGERVEVTYTPRNGFAWHVHNLTTDPHSLAERIENLESQVKHLQRQVAVLQKTR